MTLFDDLSFLRNGVHGWIRGGKILKIEYLLEEIGHWRICFGVYTTIGELEFRMATCHIPIGPITSHTTAQLIRSQHVLVNSSTHATSHSPQLIAPYRKIWLEMRISTNSQNFGDNRVIFSANSSATWQLPICPLCLQSAAQPLTCRHVVPSHHSSTSPSCFLSN
ncbi:hypothetical protein Sjap_004136 [Stephania japonica]|uniref:Uncharacterized protein n=1 Tax=Stephania japonica TaxID=461633 RepID=A0AAP0PGS3_9MAGN